MMGQIAAQSEHIRLLADLLEEGLQRSPSFSREMGVRHGSQTQRLRWICHSYLRPINATSFEWSKPYASWHIVCVISGWTSVRSSRTWEEGMSTPVLNVNGTER